VAASEICIRHTSAMLAPLTLADRAESLSRVPSQAGQGTKTAARSTKALMCGWRDSGALLNIDSRSFGMRP
jgi:hypothetical protein